MQGTITIPGVNERRELNDMDGMRLFNLDLEGKRRERGKYYTRTEQDVIPSPSNLNFFFR